MCMLTDKKIVLRYFLYNENISWQFISQTVLISSNVIFFKHENKQIFFSKIKTKRNTTILKYICRDKFLEYKQNMSLNFIDVPTDLGQVSFVIMAPV